MHWKVSNATQSGVDFDFQEMENLSVVSGFRTLLLLTVNSTPHHYHADPASLPPFSSPAKPHGQCFPSTIADVFLPQLFQVPSTSRSVAVPFNLRFAVVEHL